MSLSPLLTAPIFSNLSRNELARLESVYALGLLDTDPEPEFDEIVELATEICHAPIGLMTLVDTDRVFHKVRIGMDMVEAPRHLSVCQYTIQQGDVMIVSNAVDDDRFVGNPYIHCDGGVRFYAGAPLESPSGHKIGSLCVVDTVPRHLDASQIRSLQILAKQIATILVLRAEKVAMQRATNALNDSDRMFRAFMDALPVEAHMKDDEGHIIFYNKKLADRFGVSTKEWLGKTSHDLWTPKLAAQIVHDDETVLREGRVLESCLSTPGGDGGEPIYWKTIKVPFLRSDGRSMIAAIAMDVTADVKHQREMEEANKRLETMSLTDELTQLANRRAFDWRLHEMIALARHSGHAVSLLMIDVDNFKQLNDTFGHRAGDAVLRRMGSLLISMKRVPDMVARYGGEEFALILPQTTAQGAMKFAERILKAVRAERWPDTQVTVSIGCVELNAQMGDEEFVKTADSALYCAKRSGKDQAVLTA